MLYPFPSLSLLLSSVTYINVSSANIFILYFFGHTLTMSSIYMINNEGFSIDSYDILYFVDLTIIYIIY